MLLCCAVLCCAVLCCAVLCCAVLCCAVLCCAVLCCAVLCCAVLCCAVLGWAVLCCAVLCCAVKQLAVLRSPSNSSSGSAQKLLLPMAQGLRGLHWSTQMQTSGASRLGPPGWPTRCLARPSTPWWAPPSGWSMASTPSPPCPHPSCEPLHYPCITSCLLHKLL